MPRATIASTFMNILIIGGGFVGITAARQLQKQLGKTARITVISPSDRFLFTPRLIDVLSTGDDALAKYTVAIDTMARRDGFFFLRADVLEIHRDKKEVVCKHVPTGIQTSLPYDTLIFSPGARTSWFGVPGAKELTYALKTIEDVKAIHARIDELLHHTTRINFCVVGGGPTGIEAIFALKQYIEMRKQALSLSQACTFTLIQGAPQILPGFPLKIVNGVMNDCKRQDMEIILNEPVTRITEGHLTTTHHADISADLILWAGGLAPNSIPISPPLHTDLSGWFVVDHHLAIEPNIFAAGDITKYSEHNVTIPKNAQTAMLMAQTLSKNIIRAHRGEPLKSFHYRSKGNILIIGNVGYIDLKLFSVRTTIAPFIRDMLYRLRQREITG